MRFLPLIPAAADPAPWRSFRAVELAWEDLPHPGWTGTAPAVHALHMPDLPWDEALGTAAMAALRTSLDPDFLVLPAAAPGPRLATARLLRVLEGLLELTHGRGIKLALRPAPGAGAALARLLKEVRGEAVGFCWDAAATPDLDALSDRLFCAVGAPGDDFAPLQALGYRWNVAVPSTEPGAAQRLLAELAEAWPPVFFPRGLAAPPDPSVTFGRHFQERP